jgi:hypothetical protein
MRLADPPPRLTSIMLVSVLIRRVQAAGGFAAVIHKGDATAGSIIIDCVDRGVSTMVIERATGPDDRDTWRRVDAAATDDAIERSERLQRRLAVDPDIWIVELDIAGAERFAAEAIGSA